MLFATLKATNDFNSDEFPSPRLNSRAATSPKLGRKDGELFTMAFQNDGNYSSQGGNFGGGRGGFAPRPMVDVSSMGLKCANCGTDITELPFQPSTDRPVYCRDCNRQRRQSFGGPRGGGRNF